MPVKKSGKKFSVKDKEYDTEEKANEAYKAYIAKALGADTKKKVDKKA